MTEPNCFENTKWIINKNMAEVTDTQLGEFRKLKTSDLSDVSGGTIDDLADNFRPEQQLNGRNVYER